MERSISDVSQALQLQVYWVNIVCISSAIDPGLLGQYLVYLKRYRSRFIGSTGVSQALYWASRFIASISGVSQIQLHVYWVNIWCISSASAPCLLGQYLVYLNLCRSRLIGSISGVSQALQLQVYWVNIWCISTSAAPGLLGQYRVCISISCISSAAAPGLLGQYLVYLKRYRSRFIGSISGVSQPLQLQVYWVNRCISNAIAPGLLRQYLVYLKFSSRFIGSISGVSQTLQLQVYSVNIWCISNRVYL